MPRTHLPRPTGAELEILRVLWDQGPCTVREVCTTLRRRREIGYTTVLKFMQIMAAKGLVERDETARAHVYKARVAREQTQRQLVGYLLDRAFGGSAAKLMMQALSGRKASTEEIAQMRQMLTDFEKASEKGSEKGPEKGSEKGKEPRS
jgi:BlaI family penicillinase repressor